jgi:hypothetical protein
MTKWTTTILYIHPKNSNNAQALDGHVKKNIYPQPSTSGELGGNQWN